MTEPSSSNRSHPSPSTSQNDRSSFQTTDPSTALTTEPTRQAETRPTIAMNPLDGRELEAARQTPIEAPGVPPHDDSSSSTSNATKQSRKRAYSIDVDEANHPRIQDLRLYTPSTATPNTTEGGLGELICLCTKAPKVPRPRNAFILYRQHYQGQVAARNPGLANPEISKLIGEQWREQPEEVKNNWKRLAEEEKIRHQRQYPDYRYQPRRGGKSSGGRPLPATGEDPGHCPKCGGRYIATPRTPSTPFSAASPGSARTAGTSMPSYAIPNPRVIEMDHLRRGSGSSIMSLENHERRYPQPHMQNIDEDYPMMSPMGTPIDTKRRRFNGPNVFTGSPPMGYIPADPRYQRPSLAGPPVSATGYGPGSLPRLGRQWQNFSQSNHPSPHHPHMQPPPRPSMPFQPAPTPTRHTSTFDESLRLPPLQTQVPTSPAMNSGPGPARAPPNVPPGHTHNAPNGANAPPPKPPQPQHNIARWPPLLKLEVLRSISPPLKPPGAGRPLFETRGPLIAIEGAEPAILKEVAAVVDQALSISGEYAVKTWTEDTQTQITPIEGSGGNSINTNDNEQGIGGSGLLSPLATYVAKMLKWHKTSEDIIKYITSFPPPASAASSEMGEGPKDVEASPKTKRQLPVAVVSDGYSLTVSDRYANSLQINDAYRADDHWQWLATLWRGIVGPDLTIYVKRTAEAEAQGNNFVEFANPAVVVLHIAECGGVDEKLERRLGFEIMEWVRSGSFKAGFVPRS
ncbi:hypothetical protein F5Y11DRAFT_249528 [Daldinia sp. FL1419]|nr:hypothetical protein F5Y11DRAFT_249528 [Daldinia sp. FL1419]